VNFYFRTPPTKYQISLKSDALFQSRKTMTDIDDIPVTHPFYMYFLSIMSRLRTGRSYSTPDRGKDFFSSPPRSDRFKGPIVPHI